MLGGRRLQRVVVHGLGSDLGNATPRKTFQSEDDVFDEYRGGMSNSGCETWYSSEWFLNGTFRPQSWSNWSGTRKKNSAYGNIWGLSITFSGYYYYYSGNRSQYITHQFNTTSFGAYQKGWEHLDSGFGVGMHISWPGGGHLITCWGYIANSANNSVVAVLVTDPDDDRYAGRGARNSLRVHQVYRPGSGYWYFRTYGYGTGKNGKTYIINMTVMINIGGSMQMKIDLKARNRGDYVNETTMSADVFITGKENITARNVQVWVGEADDGAKLAATVDFYALKKEDFSGVGSFVASNGIKVASHTTEELSKEKKETSFDEVLGVSALEKGDYYIFWVIANSDTDMGNNMNYYGDENGTPIVVTSAYVDLAMDDSKVVLRDADGNVMTATDGKIDITYGDVLSLNGLQVLNIGSLPTTKAHKVNIYLTTEKDKIQNVGTDDFLLASYEMADADKVEYMGADYDSVFLYSYDPDRISTEWIDERLWNNKTMTKWVFYDKTDSEVAEYATEELARNSDFAKDTTKYTMKVETRPMTTTQVKWVIYETEEVEGEAEEGEEAEVETIKKGKVIEFDTFDLYTAWLEDETQVKPESYVCEVEPRINGYQVAFEQVDYNGSKYNTITFTMDTANMEYNKNYYITWEIVQEEDKITTSYKNPGKGLDGGEIDSRNVGSLSTSLHFVHNYLTDASEYYEITQTYDDLTFPAMKTVYDVSDLEEGTYMEDPENPGTFLVIDRDKITPVVIDGNILLSKYTRDYIQKLSGENGEDALDMMVVVHTTPVLEKVEYRTKNDTLVFTEADTAGIFTLVSLGEWEYTDANGNEVKVDEDGNPIIAEDEVITKVDEDGQVYFLDSKGTRTDLVVDIQFADDEEPLLTDFNVVIDTQVDSTSMDGINQIVENFDVFDADGDGVVIAEDETGYIFAINEDGQFYKILDPDLGSAVQILILNKERRDMPFTMDARSYCRVMLVEEGQVQLANVTLTGGKVYGYGGGIYVLEQKEGGSATVGVKLEDVTITKNVATTYGGAIYNDIGTLEIYDSTFTENKANLGGAIRNAGNMVIAGTSILKNSATDLGGGVYNVADSSKVVEITHSVIRGNSAEIGGGFYQTELQVSKPTSSEEGGEEEETSYSTTLMDNTEIAANTANIGGGVYNNGTLELLNVTIAGNSATSTAGGLYHNSGELIVNNSIISLNYASGKATDIFGTPNEELSANNLINSQSAWFEEDPVFGLGGRVVNEDTMDLHLTQSSQAIDAGNNDFINAGDVDLDGRDRIYMPPEDTNTTIGDEEEGDEGDDEEAPVIDGVVDLGCYEFQGSANLNTVYYYEIVADNAQMSEYGSMVIDEWTPFRLDLKASEGFLSTIITVQYDASIYKMDMDNTFASVYTTWDIGDPIELMTGMTQVKISVTVKEGVTLANDALIGQIAYLPIEKGGVNAWAAPTENWLTLGGQSVRLAIAPNRYDLTDDGVVNLSDMFLFLDTYGTENATTDYNENGKVDVDDMLTFAKHYGDELTNYAARDIVPKTSPVTSLSTGLKKATSAMDTATLDKIFGEY